MQIVDPEIVVIFGRKHADAKDALDAWRDHVGLTIWRTPSDLKAEYPDASILSGNRVIFDIKGRKYRLQVTVYYRRQVVEVEWIGTHAEYNRKRF